MQTLADADQRERLASQRSHCPTAKNRIWPKQHHKSGKETLDSGYLEYSS